MSQRRILVTGGAGFIGSELVAQLFKLGNQVIVADNLRNGKKENLEPLLEKGVRLLEVDILNEAVMRSLISECSVVFHLACLGVRHSLHSPRENHLVNAEGTLSLLSLAREYGVERFIYISSSEVYGTALSAPMNEAHPTLPLTVYGASKLAGESYSRAYFQSYGLPVVILRPFNTFGPRSHHEGDSGEVIPKFMLRCLAEKELIVFGKGTQTRDFTYVGDMAENIIKAAFSPRCVGQTLNLGSGREVSILELAETIASVLEKKHRIRHEDPRPGDVMRLCADTTLAQELFGFRPTDRLREGLTHLRDWYFKREVHPEELLQSERVYNWKNDRGQAVQP
jgi:UDP-glucose 4-epimerase